MSPCSSSRKRTRVTAMSLRSSGPERRTTPLITSCVRPESRRRKSSASPASAGLPKTRPSSTTAVSTPRMRRRAAPVPPASAPAPDTRAAPPAREARPTAASTFRRAFSTTNRRGSPPASSSTSTGSTTKSTPSCSRIARRWGEREARIRGSGAKLREEQHGLALGGRPRVGAVHEIGLDLEGEVAADRAGRGLERVRRPDHLARGGHRLVPLEDERDEGTAGDELDEVPEERLPAVLLVV